jgi:quinol monooxygenase YgiN
VVTLRVSAKDAADFAQPLRDVTPATRIASGCRYSHTYQSPNALAEFVLIQGWDCAAQQQEYLAWRSVMGHMAHFVSLPSKPPVVEVFNLIDA